MIAYQSSPEQKRVKVLHVITHLGAGGALDNTLLTVERLPRDRYEVDLTAGYLPDEEGYTSWEERSRQCADRLYLFPELQRQVHPVRDLRACRRLTKFIRQRGLRHCAYALRQGRRSRSHCGAPRRRPHSRTYMPCLW